MLLIFPATMVIGNLIGRFGKKKMYAIGLALAGLAPIIRLLDVRSIPLLIVSVLIAGIGAGFAAPLNYGIQADNTDLYRSVYGNWAEVLSHLFPALSPSVQWESVVRFRGICCS